MSKTRETHMSVHNLWMPPENEMSSIKSIEITGVAYFLYHLLAPNTERNYVLFELLITANVFERDFLKKRQPLLLYIAQYIINNFSLFGFFFG